MKTPKKDTGNTDDEKRPRKMKTLSETRRKMKTPGKRRTKQKTAVRQKDGKPGWLAGQGPFLIIFNGNPVMRGRSGPPKASENSPNQKKDAEKYKYE